LKRIIEAIAVMSLVAMTGCSKREPNCSCLTGDPILIHAPIGSIRTIRLSGSACTGSVSPAVSDGCPEELGVVAAPAALDCERASIAPTSAGECDVEIDMNSGQVVTRRYVLRAYSSCCGNGFSMAEGSDPPFIDLMPPGDAAGDAPG
jgi:hypothetical protein